MVRAGRVGMVVVALAALSVACVTEPPRAATPSTGSMIGTSATTPAPRAPGTTTTTAPIPDNPAYATVGLDGWQLASTADVTVDPALAAVPGYDTTGWIPVTPDDAGAPGTLIDALVRHGECPEVTRGENLKTCFGFQATHGPVTTPRFAVPWLYRTEVTSAARPGDHTELVVNGIVGEADVWLNGAPIATRAQVRGAYAKVEIDVTDRLRGGANALVLRVHPNDTTTMFTLDDVDWNPIPPDGNTGIASPVQLHTSGPVGLVDGHITQDDAPDLSQATVTVSAVLTNHGTAPTSARIGARIARDLPGEPDAIAVEKTIPLAPGEVQRVTFAATEFPQLRIDRPAVWWPYQLGDQPLYSLAIDASSNGAASDSWHDTFGIRTVTSELTPPTTLAPQGLRAFRINGRRLLIRGGGWTPDLFLRYDAADTRRQVELLRDLGLNAVRTEGHDMPDDFYRQLDRAGILIDAGFQCCMAKWGPAFDEALVSQDDLDQLDLAARSIGTRLRNHPSVFKYGWSDFTPTPRMEVVGVRAFESVDFREPLISSALYRSSPLLGPAGEKEGPYDWVPPVYWFDDQHGYDGTRDDTEVFFNVGGAWGYDSEASAGHTIPTRDSIERFLSADEQHRLWTEPAANQYHANTDVEVGNVKFGTLFQTSTAMAARYGAFTDLDDFIAKGQLLNYEDTRAQFEAYIAHTDNQPNPATGVIYWQLTKGFPSLLWTLYNDDFDQPGAYFGAKKANETVHVFFDEGRRTVGIDNLGAAAKESLTLEATVHALDGSVTDRQRVDGLGLAPLEVKRDLLTPTLPAATTPPTPAIVSLIELTLRAGDTVVSRNVYWTSSQADVIDWPATNAKSFATMTQRADLSALAHLARADISVQATTERAGGPGGRARTTVVVTNTSREPIVGFFLRADVRRGRGSTRAGGDDQVHPVVWSDNDITLWPGQAQTLTADYDDAALGEDDPVVTLHGSNTAEVTVAAG